MLPFKLEFFLTNSFEIPAKIAEQLLYKLFTWKLPATSRTYRSWLAFSVTRFDEILQLWQNFISIWQNFRVVVVFGKILNLGS